MINEWADLTVPSMYDDFVALGLDAFAATYTSPEGGAPVPCRVLVFRAQQVFGEFGQVTGSNTQIALLRCEVPVPAQRAVVRFNGETWVLDKTVSNDGIESRWVAHRG